MARSAPAKRKQRPPSSPPPLRLPLSPAAASSPAVAALTHPSNIATETMAADTVAITSSTAAPTTKQERQAARALKREKKITKLALRAARLAKQAIVAEAVSSKRTAETAEMDAPEPAVIEDKDDGGRQARKLARETKRRRKSLKADAKRSAALDAIEPAAPMALADVHQVAPVSRKRPRRTSASPTPSPAARPLLPFASASAPTAPVGESGVATGDQGVKKIRAPRPHKRVRYNPPKSVKRAAALALKSIATTSTLPLNGTVPVGEQVETEPEDTVARFSRAEKGKGRQEPAGLPSPMLPPTAPLYHIPICGTLGSHTILASPVDPLYAFHQLFTQIVTSSITTSTIPKPLALAILSASDVDKGVQGGMAPQSKNTKKRQARKLARETRKAEFRLAASTSSVVKLSAAVEAVQEDVAMGEEQEVEDGQEITPPPSSQPRPAAVVIPSPSLAEEDVAVKAKKEKKLKKSKKPKIIKTSSLPATLDDADSAPLPLSTDGAAAVADEQASAAAKKAAKKAKKLVKKARKSALAAQTLQDLSLSVPSPVLQDAEEQAEEQVEKAELQVVPVPAKDEKQARAERLAASVAARKIKLGILPVGTLPVPLSTRASVVVAGAEEEAEDEIVSSVVVPVADQSSDDDQAGVEVEEEDEDEEEQIISPVEEEEVSASQEEEPVEAETAESEIEADEEDSDMPSLNLLTASHDDGILEFNTPRVDAEEQSSSTAEDEAHEEEVVEETVQVETATEESDAEESIVEEEEDAALPQVDQQESAEEEADEEEGEEEESPSELGDEVEIENSPSPPPSRSASPAILVPSTSYALQQLNGLKAVSVANDDENEEEEEDEDEGQQSMDAIVPDIVEEAQVSAADSVAEVSSDEEEEQLDFTPHPTARTLTLRSRIGHLNDNSNSTPSNGKGTVRVTRSQSRLLPETTQKPHRRRAEFDSQSYSTSESDRDGSGSDQDMEDAAGGAALLVPDSPPNGLGDESADSTRGLQYALVDSQPHRSPIKYLRAVVAVADSASPEPEPAVLAPTKDFLRLSEVTAVASASYPVSTATSRLSLSLSPPAPVPVPVQRVTRSQVATVPEVVQEQDTDEEATIGAEGSGSSSSSDDDDDDDDDEEESEDESARRGKPTLRRKSDGALAAAAFGRRKKVPLLPLLRSKIATPSSSRSTPKRSAAALTNDDDDEELELLLSQSVRKAAPTPRADVKSNSGLKPGQAMLQKKRTSFAAFLSGSDDESEDEQEALAALSNGHGIGAPAAGSLRAGGVEMAKDESASVRMENDDTAEPSLIAVEDSQPAVLPAAALAEEEEAESDEEEEHVVISETPAESPRMTNPTIDLNDSLQESESAEVVDEVLAVAVQAQKPASPSEIVPDTFESDPIRAASYINSSDDDEEDSAAVEELLSLTPSAPGSSQVGAHIIRRTSALHSSQALPPASPHSSRTRIVLDKTLEETVVPVTIKDSNVEPQVPTSPPTLSVSPPTPDPELAGANTFKPATPRQGAGIASGSALHYIDKITGAKMPFELDPALAEDGVDEVPGKATAASPLKPAFKPLPNDKPTMTITSASGSNTTLQHATPTMTEKRVKKPRAIKEVHVVVRGKASSMLPSAAAGTAFVDPAPNPMIGGWEIPATNGAGVFSTPPVRGGGMSQRASNMRSLSQLGDVLPSALNSARGSRSRSARQESEDRMLASQTHSQLAGSTLFNPESQSQSQSARKQWVGITESGEEDEEDQESSSEGDDEAVKVDRKGKGKIVWK